MRKIIIAGNWKMNNTISQAQDLIAGLTKNGGDMHKVEVIVAPPFTALRSVYDILGQSSVHVAAQNLFWEESGAYTGEVSAMMIKEAGCKWVIIGHSERRQLFGETDETVNKRARAALASGLKPIVCIGETLEEREGGRTYDVLHRQLDGGLNGLSAENMAKVTIAYEPVWAIGTGKTATSAQAQEAHEKIRAKLSSMFGQGVADKVRILYGGSMKPSNALELLSQPDVDGGLIGGASLNAHDFVEIIKAGIEAEKL
ncbi:MAG: triose-phosphate isomerase [Nitrospinota bacterium]|nr:triose-phosphate isomerase [Nitrospinota bacterium]MDH5678973.1 triose-phosphate isomerase [Nitrospinota bacterium]MDH5755970.1 triose-phosphate isomerase [Nitrospinota bacterium]